MDNRGVTPVVEKTVAIGLVTLFVTASLGTLLGGVVPNYEQATGREVGERILASAGAEIERAVPATQANVAVRREHSLPGTIDGTGYSLVVENRTLSLTHPDPAVGGSTPLSVPSTVIVQNGTWTGGAQVIEVRGSASNRTLSVGGGES